MTVSKINIYGTGLNAAKFLMANRNIEVCRIIEGKKEKQKRMPEFFGYKVDYIEDVIEDLKSSYTIIATSEGAFLEIKRELEACDLIEYEHFEYYRTFQKKVVFVYGNCHTGSIIDALCKSKEFTNKYGIYPMLPIQDIKNHAIDISIFPLEKADIFIHQCIWEKNIYGIEYSSSSQIDKLKSNCQIIGIPNLYRMPKFMFPQIPEEFDQKYFCEFGDVSYYNFRDKYIDNNAELSVGEIYELIEDECLICADDILTQEDIFYDKLIEREKSWDIKMSSFLKSNMKKYQLFYDPNHPTPFVMSYIVSRLFDILGLKQEVSIGDNKMDAYELPIYASVRKALGLDYHQTIMRKNGLKLSSTDMDTREYIREYLLWNHSEWKPYKVEHIIYKR